MSRRHSVPHCVTSGSVKAETEYRDPSNPDEPLAPEHMVKAFRWGAGTGCVCLRME